MQIDHVAMLAANAESKAAELQEEFGLGAERGMYYPRAGTRHWFVPFLPPQGLEILQIEDREAARTGPDGKAVLECEARGFGLFSWCVLVDDLDSVSDRLGIEIFDYTLAQPDGTLRGWRTVSGAPNLPFFIDYPNNGDRAGRFMAKYTQVGHASAPTRFAGLTISGSQAVHRDWLGPNDLPLQFVAGDLGVIEARVETAWGEALIR
jgi:hypothetical protein